MDYQREIGRLRGLQTRRQNAVDFARKKAPLIRQARTELTKGLMDEPSDRQISKWLNERNYKTITGKTWRGDTVAAIGDAAILRLNDIEDEYAALVRIRRGVRHFSDVTVRRVSLDDLGDIEQWRVDQIIEARKLRAELHDQPYVDEPIPPPLCA